ncbi:hypothetical protein [Schaedlerella sp.]
MAECFIVGLGGFIGAVCRYLIGLIPLRVRHFHPLRWKQAA